jgi:hypothetical protein
MFSRDIKGRVNNKMTNEQNKMNALTFILPPIGFILDCSEVFVKCQGGRFLKKLPPLDPPAKTFIIEKKC